LHIGEDKFYAKCEVEKFRGPEKTIAMLSSLIFIEGAGNNFVSQHSPPLRYKNSHIAYLPTPPPLYQLSKLYGNQEQLYSVLGNSSFLVQ